jgi:hypothetical protein
MKTCKRILLAAALAVWALLGTACAREATVLNFSRIISLDWSFEPAAGGARLLLKNLVVRFANDTGATADGNVRIEWGNGRTEDALISLPDTGGLQYTESFWWPEDMRSDLYEFKGEMTVTVKLTIRFLGDMSPVFERTVTLTSL